MQLSNHLPCKTTPSCLGMTKGATRSTFPVVFCFSRCPYSSIILLTSDTSDCPSFGNLSCLWIFWTFSSLGISSRESTFSSSPEGFLMVLERICLRVGSPGCEGILVFTGRKVQGGDTQHSSLRTRTSYAKMQTALHCWETRTSISWPPSHCFWTPTLEHFASTGVKSPINTQPPSLSLRLCPLVLLLALHASCCQDIPMGRAGEHLPRGLADGSSLLLLLYPHIQVIEFCQFSLTTTSFRNVSFRLPPLPLRRHLRILFLS